MTPEELKQELDERKAEAKRARIEKDLIRLSYWTEWTRFVEERLCAGFSTITFPSPFDGGMDFPPEEWHLRLLKRWYCDRGFIVRKYPEDCPDLGAMASFWNPISLRAIYGDFNFDLHALHDLPPEPRPPLKSESGFFKKVKIWLTSIFRRARIQE